MVSVPSQIVILKGREADVRFGSLATFARRWHARFASKSDHGAGVPKSMLSGNLGMMPSGRSSRDGASGQQGRSRRRPFHNGQRPTE